MNAEITVTQQEIELLNTQHAEALDDGDLDRWSTLFVESCRYSVVTRENVQRGLPYAILLCESRGMMVDRALALKMSTFLIPRVQRRIVSGIRVLRVEGERIHAKASFAIFETFTGESTTVYGAGRYEDVIGRDQDGLKFIERKCIFDSPVVPNSMPFPI